MKREIAAAVMAVCAAGAFAQARCEGGAYLNPRTLSGDSAATALEAESALGTFMARSGLPAKPMSVIRRKDDATELARSTRPPCCMGLGYKVAVVNIEPVRPVVYLLSEGQGSGTTGPLPIESLAAAEQTRLRERLKKSRCFGMDADTSTALVRAQGMCAKVDDVAPRSGIGPQVLPVKAAFDWSEPSWTAFVMPASAPSAFSLKGLAGKSDKVASARIVAIASKVESFGYGLYVHPSVGEIERLKAASIFLDISEPARPLAGALDLGPKFSFQVPTAAQVVRMESALGIGL